MKANEAPEKIYLHPTANGKVGASWLTFALTNEDVEYTRTDAFIEKACEWISEIENGTTITDINKFVEGFKKYMKGE